MNFYLLNLFGKWVSLGILSILSLFGFEIEEKNLEVNNDTVNKNVNVVSNIIEFETIKLMNCNNLIYNSYGDTYSDEEIAEVYAENYYLLKNEMKLQIGI